MSGFHSALALAPEEGIGVIVFSNTGGLDGRGAPEPLAPALLRRLLGLPVEAVRTDIPPHPETWSEICGWYGPAPGPATNVFSRALMGAGAEVVVHGGNLMETPTPIPAMRRGFVCIPTILTTRGRSASASRSSGWNSVWYSTAAPKN